MLTSTLNTCNFFSTVYAQNRCYFVFYEYGQPLFSPISSTLSIMYLLVWKMLFELTIPIIMKFYFRVALTFA